MKKIITICLLIATTFTTNTLFAQKLFEKNNKYGVQDKNGVVIIEAIYNTIVPLPHNGRLAIVSIGKKYGLIKSNGEQIIPTIYQEIESINDSILTTKLKNKYGLISIKGREIIPPTYEIMNNNYELNLIIVQLNNKSGFITADGTIKIPLIYDSVGQFENGYSMVGQNKKIGIIDINGEVIIPIKYDYIRIEKSTIINSVYFTTEINKKHGLYTISSQNSDSNSATQKPNTYKELITPKYDYISLNNNGSWQVSLNELKGIINSKGVEIITPTYRSISLLNHGFFSVSMQDNDVFSKNPTGRQPSALMSPTGKLLTPFKFNFIYNDSEGLFQVQNFENGSKGVIDETGKVITPN
jgi:hypothetical protein